MLLCMAMGLSITACGESRENETADSAAVSSSAETASSSVDSTSETEDITVETETPILDKEDYTLEECIALGEYKGLSFTQTVKEVTDGQILLRISQQTGLEAEELKDADAVVQEGDTAVIEYVGKKDGVAFEGGTSTEPYDLQIGSGTFIDGFEDGIIGMKAGETKDLNLTFPENYGSEELAGQDVVFTVTVNSIKRLILTDEWVEENADTEFSNTEEYMDSFRTVLKEENESEAENNLKTEAWTAVRNASVFKALPRTLVDAAAAEYKKSAEQMASMYSYTLEQLIEAYGKETYKKEMAEYAETDAKNTLLLQAMMEAEGIEKDGAEYEAAMSELVESVGAESADELISSYGQDEIDDTVLKTVVVEKILSYANITEA